MLSLLWLVNLGLILALLFLLWRWQELHESNQGVHQQLDELRQEQAEIVGQNESMIQAIEDLNLKTYRKRVEQFKSIQLSFQTQWVSLLDHLGEVLPEDVRMMRLTPNFNSSKGKGPREVRLKLEAETRNKEAQLAFIRALNESKHFDKVRFESEDYQKEGVALAFVLSFTYKGQGGRS